MGRNPHWREARRSSWKALREGLSAATADFCSFFNGYKNKNVRNIYYGGFGNDGERDCLPHSRAFQARVAERLEKGLPLDCPRYLASERFLILSGCKK